MQVQTKRDEAAAAAEQPQSHVPPEAAAGRQSRPAKRWPHARVVGAVAATKGGQCKAKAPEKVLESRDCNVVIGGQRFFW